MKAIRVHEHGGPEVLKLEETDEPRPAEGQVLVQVRAAGVNPVDTYIRDGVHGYAAKLPFLRTRWRALPQAARLQYRPLGGTEGISLS